MEVNTPSPYENRNKEQQDKPVTNDYVQNAVSSPCKNPLGTAGFALSAVTFVVGWVPELGFIVWVLGAIFSGLGIFRKPRYPAIAGVWLSFCWLIIVIWASGILTTYEDVF